MNLRGMCQVRPYTYLPRIYKRLVSLYEGQG